MEMNMKEWVTHVKQSEARLAIPLMTHPGIDLIGKNVFDAVTNGRTHFEAIAALNKKYPAAASTIIMDLTVEAEAFGSKISFSTHEVPTITGSLVTDHESAMNLDIPRLDAGRIRQYLHAAALAAEQIKEKPVFAGCIGPLSLAGRLYDMTEMMTAMYLDAAAMHVLLEKCTTFIADYADAFKKAGTNGILIAEPAAGLLSVEMCDEFSSTYIKEIIDKVQDKNFIVLLHNCGNPGHLTGSMLSTGATALHLGNKLNLVDALQQIPETTLVLGNLDPVDIFKSADPQKVYDTTLKLLEDTARYSNFIISSGCDTPPGVPHANIYAFYNALAFFNKESMHIK